MDNKTFMDVVSLKTALVPLGTATTDLSSDLSDLDDSNSELIENWIGDSMITYMLVIIMNLINILMIMVIY